jgi:Protein of unknown function, DUF255
MNRLAGETGPYLQQHAANPADEYPWGGEDLAPGEARERADTAVDRVLGVSRWHTRQASGTMAADFA